MLLTTISVHPLAIVLCSKSCISKTALLLCMCGTIGKLIKRSNWRQVFLHRGAISTQRVHPTAIAVPLVFLPFTSNCHWNYRSYIVNAAMFVVKRRINTHTTHVISMWQLAQEFDDITQSSYTITQSTLKTQTGMQQPCYQ